MSIGGNVLVLDGERSDVQNKATGQKTRIKYEDVQRIVYMWAPAKECEAPQ